MNENTQKQAVEHSGVESVLRRYLALQQQEQQIKEEKAGLQAVLANHMTEIERETWYSDVDGQKLRVRCRESVSIEYNEQLLRQRLTDRYAAILKPDLKKMRRCLDDMEPLLAPMLNRVGSPSPDKIREAVDSGVVRKEEFDGTFERTTRHNVSVTRLRSANGEDRVAPHAG